MSEQTPKTIQRGDYVRVKNDASQTPRTVTGLSYDVHGYGCGLYAHQLELVSPTENEKLKAAEREKERTRLLGAIHTATTEYQKFCASE